MTVDMNPQEMKRPRGESPGGDSSKGESPFCLLKLPLAKIILIIFYCIEST